MGFWYEQINFLCLSDDNYNYKQEDNQKDKIKSFFFFDKLKSL